MQLVSMRAYARHRGVSLKAVQKAVQSGRIEKTPSGLIDVEIADANWASRTAPRPLAAKPIEKSAENAQQRPTERVPGNAEPRFGVSKTDLPSSGADYSRARAVRENYLARMAKIEFEERSGKLMSRDEVTVAAFNKFRTFRDGILNIPDRVAAVLAAETDPVRVHELLSSEIRKVIIYLADTTVVRLVAWTLKSQQRTETPFNSNTLFFRRFSNA